MMTLQEIGAAVAKLLSRADGDLKAEVESIKATVAGALTEALAKNAELTSNAERVAADLATAKTTICELEIERNEAKAENTSFQAALDAAVAAKGLTVAETATAAEKITALKTAVSATLSKMGVKAGDIPAGSPSASGSEAKTVTRDQFEAMTLEQRNAHFQNGGKIKD